MKVADGVYAVLDLFHPYGVNAGIITSGRHTLFVDAGMTIGSARTIVGYASAVAPGARPLYLILTEHHSDHIFGMSVMKGLGCHVLAAKGFNDFIASAADYREFIISVEPDRAAAEIIYAGVQVGPADREIEAETVLSVDDIELELIPTPGHLLDGLSVFVRGSRVLFCGDLIYSGFTPTTRFGNPQLWRLWIKSLERIVRLDPRVIVPGHGMPCDAREIPRHVQHLKRLIGAASADQG